MIAELMPAVSGRALLRDSDHERVEIIQDPVTGLRAVIAIHSTALGPAVGGLRMLPYPDLDAAVRDALRLAFAMSLKNAATDLQLGGGKAVIVDDAAPERRRRQLLAFADAVEALDGAYVTAEDVGTGPEDMDLLATRTKHVLGCSPERGGSGDPSPATARTVLHAIRAGARARLGGADLAGLRVGVVGVGKVGGALAALLAAQGAELLLADADEARAHAIGSRVSAPVTTPDRLLRERLDVLAPCATGEMIDVALAEELRCAVVAGAANNPLADDATAVVLQERGVLYVPDFLANCGGMISIAAEYRKAGPEFVDARIRAAADRLESVLADAQREDRMPLLVAREQAIRAIADARRRLKDREER